MSFELSLDEHDADHCCLFSSRLLLANVEKCSCSLNTNCHRMCVFVTSRVDYILERNLVCRIAYRVQVTVAKFYVHFRRVSAVDRQILRIDSNLTHRYSKSCTNYDQSVYRERDSSHTSSKKQDDTTAETRTLTIANR